MRFLDRFLKSRRKRPAAARLSLEQEEERSEIAKAERETERENASYAENLIRKAAHSRYPFLDDPFE